MNSDWNFQAISLFGGVENIDTHIENIIELFGQSHV